MHGKLNLFQRTMVQWDSLHPYNAVHVARVDAALDPDRVRSVIAATLRHRGLGPLALEVSRGQFEYLPGETDFELRTLRPGPNPEMSLSTEVEHQINRRFDTTHPFCPFRFFLLPDGTQFHLGLAYYHPVADAEAVVVLLCDMIQGYAQGRAVERTPAPRLNPAPRLLRLSRHGGVLLRKCLGLPGQIQRFRRSVRLPDARPGDLANLYHWWALGTADTRAIVAASRSWGVTVNDLWMALLLNGVSAVSPSRTETERRNQLSAGCIVNLRRDLNLDGNAVFGLFLGSFSVTHRVPDGMSLADLARAVNAQTAEAKRRRSYLATSVDLTMARLALRFVSPGRQAKFYTKNHPLCGGITNLNLNRIPSADRPPILVDYLRGVSTGPITPLVFSVTTVGHGMNVGISARPSVFPAERMKALESGLRETIRSLPERH